MIGIVDFAVSRARLVLVTLAVLMLAGVGTFLGLPKEADPDIPIPFVYVGVPLEGASPEDAERLVVRPLETELRALDGLVEINCGAVQGFGFCITEFGVDFDVDQALIDVRAEVDEARRLFPAEVDSWTIQEFNASLAPVIAITIFGDVPERTLYRRAKELQRELEALPTVLAVDLSGAREEVVEIALDPARFEAYGLGFTEVLAAVSGNNRLVAAGVVETGPGRFQVKVPGLFTSTADILALPVRASGEGVVTLADVAEVRRTFKDRESVARFDGRPALALQVRKRLGANIIETTEAAQARATAVAADWPDAVQMAFSLDQSRWIRESIGQLGASIGSAVVLVLILVVAVMGLRSGLIVGLSIPASFLMAFLFLGVAGMNINFMVLFGMVLAVGMLVDAGIVVVEDADRRIGAGVDRGPAYVEAGRRMFWPIVSSTATTLCAFIPFLFWNSLPGKYMSFLPKTLIFVLTASILTALIFLPTIGAVFGPRPRRGAGSPAMPGPTGPETSGDVTAPPPRGVYPGFVMGAVRRPILVLSVAAVIVVGIWQWFGATPHRAEFFLDAEPEQAFVYVRARGNLAAGEMDALGREATERLLDIEDVRSIFTVSGSGGFEAIGQQQPPPDDTVATLFIDFLPHGQRRYGREIVADITARLEDFPGVEVEVRPLEYGPPVGKDVQIELTGDEFGALAEAARLVRARLEATAGLEDIEDTLPLPGVEWTLEVDREAAGRFGVDVEQIGAAVQLVTNGALVGRYRPDDSEEEIDLRLRFDAGARDLGRLDRLRIATPRGLVPLDAVVTRSPVPQVDRISRRNGERLIEVRANAAEGESANLILDDLKAWAAEAPLPTGVELAFLGADEETADAAGFFLVAMAASLFMMAAILLLQFNNFWHVFLTLFAVVLSVTGVLLGIQLSFEYISVLMVGTGVVALAGIVVNNNIILIDTFQDYVRRGFAPDLAVTHTCAERVRPVLLTTITTILGLLPMVFMVNANFLSGEITFGGPSAEWWVPLAKTVVWGLGFSTLLTLVVTPVLLVLPHRIGRAVGRLVRVVRPVRAQAAEAA